MFAAAVDPSLHCRQVQRLEFSMGVASRWADARTRTAVRLMDTFDVGSHHISNFRFPLSEASRHR